MFEHYMRPSNALRRYNGCRLVAALGCVLVLCGCVLLRLTRSVLLRVPYELGQQQAHFLVTSDMRGPFAVYVHLSQFYANVRQYVDRGPEYFGECEDITRVGDVWTVRERASFPELANFTDDAPLSPCGLQTATFFNDYFDIFRLDCAGCPIDGLTDLALQSDEFLSTCCSRTMQYTYDTASIGPSGWFTLFADRPRNPSAWTDILTNTRLQNWYLKPFLNSRMILVGIITNYFMEQGIYQIVFTQNVWPSATFKTSKEVVVATFGSMGSHQTLLGYLAVLWGLGLIVIALVFYWAVRRNIVFQTETMADIPASEIQSQWIQHAKNWSP